MKITGELLKSQRQNLRLSVQDVSTALKLSSKTITALEEGHLDKLPSKTFIRGFVKSYAQFLKLDGDAVLRQFQEEMGSTTPLPKVPPPMPISESEAIKSPRPTPKQTAQNYSVDNSSTLSEAFKDADGQKKIILMISMAVGLIIILVTTNKIIDAFSGNPIATAPTQDALLITNDVKPPAAEPTGATSESVSTASAATSSSAENPAVLAPPAATPPAEVAKVKQDSAPSTISSGFNKSEGKPVEVMLEAKKELEIFYARADANQLTSLKLSANQVQILRSPVGLYLKVSDGAAVKISVNGITKGLAGAANKEILLSF